MTGNINFGTGPRLQNTISILQQMLWLAPSLMVLLPGKGSEMIMDDPLWWSVTTASLIALRNTYVIDREYHGVCLLMAFLRVVYPGPILNVCGIPWARVPWWRERGKRPAEYWHFPFFHLMVSTKDQVTPNAHLSLHGGLSSFEPWAKTTSPFLALCQVFGYSKEKSN